MRSLVYLMSGLGHIAVCFASGYIPDLKVAFRREGRQVYPFLLIGQRASVWPSLERPVHLQPPFKVSSELTAEPCSHMKQYEDNAHEHDK